MTRALLIALAVFVACILFRAPLERDPVLHVLLQLPLLALAGAVLVPAGRVYGGDWNNGGFAALLIAMVGIVFWMLPRSIDAALTSPAVEVFKFISIPLLVGIPLRIGWNRAHPLLRGFLKAQTISMLGVMAFVYTHAPVRICNAYLVDDQIRLGYGFLFVTIALALVWTAPLFAGSAHKPSLPPDLAGAA